VEQVVGYGFHTPSETLLIIDQLIEPPFDDRGLGFRPFPQLGSQVGQPLLDILQFGLASLLLLVELLL
jgi:hypothetical protein